VLRDEYVTFSENLLTFVEKEAANKEANGAEPLKIDKFFHSDILETQDKISFAQDKVGQFNDVEMTDMESADPEGDNTWTVVEESKVTEDN